MSCVLILELARARTGRTDDAEKAAPALEGEVPDLGVQAEVPGELDAGRAEDDELAMLCPDCEERLDRICGRKARRAGGWEEADEVGVSLASASESERREGEETHHRSWP